MVNFKNDNDVEKGQTAEKDIDNGAIRYFIDIHGL